MRRFLVEDDFLNPLTDLDSFVIPKNEKLFSGQILAEDESVIGIYINEQDNLVILTETAVYWLNNDVLKQIEYDSITWVDVIDDSLRLELQIDAELKVPIRNKTDEAPDVYSMRDFLIRLLFYPSDSHNLEMITEIHTRRDLSNFLNDEDFSKFARLSASLRHGFPKKWQLERFNIDPEAIDTPDVWRLLALFLTSDLSDNSNEDRPRRPSKISIRDHFSLGEERLSQTFDYESEPMEIPPHIRIRLTDDTANVIHYAEEESRRLGLNFVGLEMILLASIVNFRVLSLEVLHLTDIEILKLANAIVAQFGINQQTKRSAEKISLNKRSLDIFEKAFQIATREFEQRQDDPEDVSITPKHLLQALLSPKAGAISQILEKIRDSK